MPDIDLSHYWMPFTNNRYFKANPRLFASAKDMHYRTANGDLVLDATAGLWCVNAGHARAPIVEAIRARAADLDYAPSFQLGHPLAFEAASRVAGIMPEGLDRIFLTNSGSESADTAMKIALAYHRARGAGQRTRFIGRSRGYHGTNFGGMSVGGIGGNRRQFGSQVWGIDHLADTHGSVRRFQRGMSESNGDPAGELEAKIALHGPDQIAAVIVEPVAGSTGVLVPPKGYLERLREITSTHGILLIFDEVITAFGRLGHATGAERFGVVPDLLTMAKGINNGSVPMGAVAASRKIHDTILDGSADGIEFAHGYTYSGHPIAMAAAIATIDTYQSDGLFERARQLERLFEDAVHALGECPHVIDIRNLGLMAAIELAPREGAPGARGTELFRRCFDAGLLVRATGDTIALSPPLIVSEAQIEEIMKGLRKALTTIG
jgi:beta-alanine--pyruvate transaminase